MIHTVSLDIVNRRRIQIRNTCCFGFSKQCRDDSAYAREPGKAYADVLTCRNDEILNSYNAGFILNLRTYTTTEEDYQLFQSHMWNNLTAEERTSFKDASHLLPTKNSVADYNKLYLAKTAQPILQCMAKHNCSSAKKASVDDADGLEPMVLLAEGAKVMITRNLWTSKGM